MKSLTEVSSTMIMHPNPKPIIANPRSSIVMQQLMLFGTSTRGVYKISSPLVLYMQIRLVRGREGGRAGVGAFGRVRARAIIERRLRACWRRWGWLGMDRRVSQGEDQVLLAGRVIEVTSCGRKSYPCQLSGNRRMSLDGQSGLSPDSEVVSRLA